MDNLKISAAITDKLHARHGVTRREIEQCFYNCEGGLLVDTRELRRTNPPTLWFLAKTNHGRLLKVVYIQRESDVHLKTAYEPNADEVAIYRRFG